LLETRAASQSQFGEIVKKKKVKGQSLCFVSISNKKKSGKEESDKWVSQ
jgi:hypothetical protein